MPRDESACMKYVTTCSTCPCRDILRSGLSVYGVEGEWGGAGEGCTAHSGRPTKLNGRPASDVRNFLVCVMFAQTDERRRSDVSDEDNNLSAPCAEYQATAQKRKK